jgi:hypothetical protein
MELRKILKASCMLLACYFTVLGTTAASETSVICDSTFQLKSILQRSGPKQSISNPLETITILKRIAAELETISGNNPNSILARLQNDFSGIVGKYENVTGKQYQDFDATGSVLFRVLAKHIGGLNRAENIFECKKAMTLTDQLVALNSSYARRKSAGWWSKISRVSAITASFSVLPILALLTYLIASHHLKHRRRNIRKICCTSMIISYGNQCSFTRIFDMSRYGMKIEVSQIHKKNVWNDLYFCGHKIKGKIVWQNTHFAGIKFKTKVSQQALDDVIEHSHKPFAETGLMMPAKPCFHAGCHLNCPLYIPTIISEEADAS